MANIIFDLCLYTSTTYGVLDDCEFRKYLKQNQIEFKDLNYFGTDLEETIFPLNSWLSPEDEKLTVNSFPFVIYQILDTRTTGSSRIVLHRTLDSLKTDKNIKKLANKTKWYNPVKWYRWCLKKLN